MKLFKVIAAGVVLSGCAKEGVERGVFDSEDKQNFYNEWMPGYNPYCTFLVNVHEFIELLESSNYIYTFNKWDKSIVCTDLNGKPSNLTYGDNKDIVKFRDIWSGNIICFENKQKKKCILNFKVEGSKIYFTKNNF